MAEPLTTTRLAALIAAKQQVPDRVPPVTPPSVQPPVRRGPHLNNPADPLWVLDAKRRIVQFNRAFLQFTGRNADAVTGHLEAEVLDGLNAGHQVIMHPADKIKDAGRVVARE